MIRILEDKDALSLIERKAVRLEEAERIVAPILADVRERGDAALLEYARKFDGFEGASVRLEVRGSLPPVFARAVETAAKNIREYAELQAAATQPSGHVSPSPPAPRRGPPSAGRSPAPSARSPPAAGSGTPRPAQTNRPPSSSSLRR
jgi:hypothetical protein